MEYDEAAKGSEEEAAALEASVESQGTPAGCENGEAVEGSEVEAAAMELTGLPGDVGVSSKASEVQAENNDNDGMISSDEMPDSLPSEEVSASLDMDGGHDEKVQNGYQADDIVVHDGTNTSTRQHIPPLLQIKNQKYIKTKARLR
jgi:hypothetical protein